MKRLFLVTTACTLLLTGCAFDTSKIPIIGDKLSKQDDNADPEYPIEYDADGNVIPVEVTDPETGETYMVDPVLGLRIDTSIDSEIPNADGVFEETPEVTSVDLLGQMTAYPQLTITLYGINGTPRIVDQYVYDDFNNTAVRYEYDAYNTVSMTYFDNKTNKAYTNLGMRGWQELSNERLEGLQVILNPDGFQQEEFYKSGDYIYLKGTLPVQSVGTGRDIISRMILNNFRSLSDLKINAMYGAEENLLFRLEITIVNEDGEYLLSVVPNMSKQTVVVPENVIYKEQVEDPEIDTEMERIPAYAYIKPIVYGDVEEVTREVVLNTYGFKRTDIVSKYGEDLNIDEYLEMLATILDDDMSILDFVQSMGDGGHADAAWQAAASTIYEFVLKRDSEMTDEEISALDIKPEPVEYPVEYDEDGNVILIEETDDDGNTIWINPETGEQVNEDGTPIESGDEQDEGEESEDGEDDGESETDSQIMYATTTVNVRKGPGTGFDKVGSVVEGTAVTVTGPDEDDPSWFHVILEDGTEGCMKSDYLKE